MENPEYMPTLEIPANNDIVISGDLVTQAETMSDDEMKALIISCYQMCMEILAFTRDMRHTLDSVSSNGGPMGAMIRGMRG